MKKSNNLNLEWLSFKVAERTDTNPHKAEMYVKAVLRTITEALEDGKDVKLFPHLGKFYIKQYGARKTRNPHANEMIVVPPTKIIKFKPAKGILEKINEKKF